VVLKDGVVARLDDSGGFRGVGELAVVLAQLAPDGQAALFLDLRIA
jgi:hypothetical protein